MNAVEEQRTEIPKGLSGRGRRYVIKTSNKRKVRLDIVSDRALTAACRLLADPDNLRDTVSSSMLVRRAVRLYHDYLDRLRATDPTLCNEKQAVRQMSQLPGPRRRRSAVVSGTA